MANKRTVGSDDVAVSVEAAVSAWTGFDEPKSMISASGLEGDSFWRLYNGDSRRTLAKLPSNSVNCVVTSPAYYWQRDYGVKGQLGKERTPQVFVNNLRRVFKELHRIVRRDGTVFLNLGDTYYSAKGRPHGVDPKHQSRRMAELRAVDGPGLGLPRKSLIGIPWRVALALQKDGWTLRSDIIWARETAVPEPTAHDRPWRSYEHVFLFSKSPHYYFDREGLAGMEDIWIIEPDRNSQSRGIHYAPYPKDLVNRCLACGCPDGGVVLDPFVGGGTTMYEALRLGRSAVGVELNSNFFALIQRSLRSPAQHRTVVDLGGHRRTTPGAEEASLG